MLICKMMTKTILLFCMLCAVSCKVNNTGNYAIVEGDLGSNINEKIYLIDINKKDVVKDSTKVINGKFKFKFSAGKDFEPYQASLLMLAHSSGIGYRKPLGFINPFISNRIESIFYLDRGVTTIGNPVKTGNHYCYKITGSDQNIPMYKNILFNGRKHDASSAERQELLQRDNELIKLFSNSEYLLNLLCINRKQYTSEEIKSLMKSFSDKSKHYQKYKYLEGWLAFKESKADILTNLILTNNYRKEESLFKDGIDKSIIIFWASWCVPCRQEIPHLKAIYSYCEKRHISITSISLDNNQENWQTAIKNEKMPWRQLIVNDSTKRILSYACDISSIPLIVFVDNQHRIIMRLNGYQGKENLLKTILSVQNSKKLK